MKQGLPIVPRHHPKLSQRLAGQFLGVGCIKSLGGGQAEEDGRKLPLKGILGGMQGVGFQEGLGSP
jgi:hypothetical protein